MTKGEVTALLGKPASSHSFKRGTDTVELCLYRSYLFPGIPNVFMENSFIIPPAGGDEAQIQFVNGRLQRGAAPKPQACAAHSNTQRARTTPAPQPEEESGEFNFEGIKFGMSRSEVEEAVNKIDPRAGYHRSLHKSTGFEYGDYFVDNPAHKILAIYFRFDGQGRLSWMRAQYPYSSTEPWKTKPVLDSITDKYVKNAAQRHKDIEVQFDKARMSLTIISKPVRDKHQPVSPAGGRG
jgi:hypothetical protein